MFFFKKSSLLNEKTNPLKIKRNMVKYSSGYVRRVRREANPWRVKGVKKLNKSDMEGKWSQRGRVYAQGTKLKQCERQWAEGRARGGGGERSGTEGSKSGRGRMSEGEVGD